MQVFIILKLKTILVWGQQILAAGKQLSHVNFFFKERRDLILRLKPNALISSRDWRQETFLKCSYSYVVQYSNELTLTWDNCPARPQFYISFTIIYTSQKKKNERSDSLWLSVWVCSSYVLKIFVNLSLNVLIKKGYYKRKKNSCQFVKVQDKPEVTFLPKKIPDFSLALVKIVWISFKLHAIFIFLRFSVMFAIYSYDSSCQNFKATWNNVALSFFSASFCLTTCWYCKETNYFLVIEPVKTLPAT